MIVLVALSFLCAVPLNFSEVCFLRISLKVVLVCLKFGFKTEVSKLKGIGHSGRDIWTNTSV